MELNDLLEKPVFVNTELEQPISLQEAEEIVSVLKFSVKSTKWISV